MNGGQVTDVCPQCGSSAQVHSVQELADLARMQLGQQAGPAGPQGANRPSGPSPASPAQAGWEAEPQAGPVPGPGGVQPGWAAQPRTGPIPGPGQRPGPSQVPRPRRPGLPDLGDALSLDSLGDDLASAALGAAAGLLGRSVARRMRGRVEQAMSAVGDRQQDRLRQQIAIAERHPDLRACLNDQVVFLAGGQRVLPMAGLATSLTVEQSDAIVARLRG